MSSAYSYTYSEPRSRTASPLPPCPISNKLHKGRCSPTFSVDELLDEYQDFYVPPPLPSLGRSEEPEYTDPEPELKHDLRYEMVKVQLRVDFAVHRAKKSIMRKIGLK